METLDNCILYVDDEETNLFLFQATFSFDYHVFIANSTQAAEALIHEHQFKVVLADINMPEETGLEFFKRIRFEKFEPVLIILTAFVSSALLLEALHQGRIFRYLTKPWQSRELKHAIDQAIQTFDLYYQNRMLDLQIKESERKFYNMFQYSRDGIVIFDEANSILEANEAFLNLTQKSQGEINTMRISDFLEEIAIPLFNERVKNLTDQNPSVFEYEFYIPGSEKRVVEANSSLIEYKGGNAVLSIIRDITDRKLQEKAIVNAVIQAEEKERSRIAKDLHDGLGPILATLKMYIEWLCEKKKVDQHPDILNLSMSSVGEAIVTLKNISNNLSPHVLEKFGLISALTSFVDRVKKISDIQFITDTNLKERLSSVIEVSLYRVITECINNTLKHAKATEISIKIYRKEDSLNLIYSDNGKGFDIKSALEVKSGMGLHNIQNRITTLGGKVNFKSMKNKGTEISAEVFI